MDVSTPLTRIERMAAAYAVTHALHGSYYQPLCDMTRLIEQRKPTNQPLVEITANADGSDGSFEPTGRRFHAFDDGSNSYALTDAEECAYFLALAHLSPGLVDETRLRTGDESKAIEAARVIDPNVDVEKVVADYRAAHPLPTAFAALPVGHPCSNYAADDTTNASPIAGEPGNPAPATVVVVSTTPAVSSGSSAPTSVAQTEPTGKAPIVPALTLTVAEHLHAKTLLARIEESVMAKGHAALMELRALLRHA